MPVFSNPRQAIIIEGAGLGAALPIAGALLVIAAVAAFIAAHLLLLGLCVAVAVIALTAVLALMRRAARPQLAEQHLAAGRAAVAAPPPLRAIAPPAQHLHIHLHGLGQEDAAAVLRRALDATGTGTELVPGKIGSDHMSWAVGFDPKWNRDIGYGVPATCDRPKCGEAIDRGLSYVCGGQPYGGEAGCGLYFCGQHLTGSRKMGDRHVWVCGRCDKGRAPYEPTPDIPEWLRWKLTDESWARWRSEHPEAVAQATEALAG